MGLPAAGNVVRIRHLISAGNPLPFGFRCFMQYTGGPPTVANLNALASGAQTAFGTNLKSLMSSNISLSQIIVDDLSSVNGASGVWNGILSGTRAGSIPTDSTCALLDLSIARRYRGGKPKIFLPFGIVSDLSNPNAWGGAFVTAVNNGWNAYITALVALTGIGITLTNQANVSYFKGSTANPNPSKWAKKNVPALRATPVLDPITAVSTRIVPGNQRRRRGSS